MNYDSLRQYLEEGNATGITFGSKSVEKGNLFVCKGVHFKEEYLEEAVSRGATAYVSEMEYAAGSSIKAFIVPDIRKAMQVAAEGFYGPVYDKLKLTGITGTKGKSSTTYFMVGIIDEYMAQTGKGRSAVLSTINNYDGVTEEESQLTTPEIMELYRHMNNAVQSGIEYMTMEVSSQALKVGRVEGVRFDVGCFLNISPDHISSIEHPDFDDYFDSKLRLFGMCRIACINLDSDGRERIEKAAEAAGRVVSFSRKDERANIFGYNIRSVNGRINFDVRVRGLSDIGVPDFEEHVELGSFGMLNVENALAAIAISVCYRIPFAHIREGLRKTIVPGRTELFVSADERTVFIVDYAHNKLSFEKLIETVRFEFPDRELYAVFGCVGDKAYDRREEMGTIAGRNCVKAYITEQHPGEEDVVKICNEIAAYVETEGGCFEVVPDRGEAIRRAVSEVKDGVVLVIGRGREKKQKRGLRYVATPSDVDYLLGAIDEGRKQSKQN